jgi:hypothetical protein
LLQVGIFLKENEVPAYLIEEMFRHASNDAYWLSARDEANLGYKSAAFKRYLAENCAWSDSVEEKVYAHKRPLEELTQMMRCRARVTQAAAHKALAQANIEVAAPGKCQATRVWSLMVQRNRLLPCLGPNDLAILQQGACVLVEERLRIARNVETAAPGENMILHGLDVL